MTQLEKIVKFWQESGEKDLTIARKLFKSKDYGYCLFFCHLTLEKVLKAIIIQKTNKLAPFSHDLTKLAILSGVIFKKAHKAELDNITHFNIAGRYDDEKKQFYKKCTRPYALKFLKITEEIFIWLKENYQK